MFFNLYRNYIMAITRKYRKTKSRKTKFKKTKVKKTKSRKTKSRKTNLKGGNRSNLIKKLNKMLIGQHALTTADSFIDEVIHTMCPDISSPKKRRITGDFGPDGTPIDKLRTPTHGPFGTPYESWVSRSERLKHYMTK